MTEVLSTLKETVTGSAEMYPLPRTLRASLLLRPPPRRWSLFPWGTFLRRGLIAALLFLAFAVGAGLVRKRDVGLSDDLLAQTLVTHHLHVSSGADDLGISSDDPDVVAAWFQTQVPFPVQVSSFADGHLLGGRVGVLHDQPVALVSYERDGAPLSLFTLAPRTRTVASEDTQPSGAGLPRCSTVFNEYTFCLQESEDAVHAVVAEGLRKGEEIAHSLLFPLSNK
jgi:anti-sigma factor RsiW